MNQPDEITRQLANKYTHELFIPQRGIAKFDKITWRQNFYGWQPNQKKKWKQSFDFAEIPSDIYARYDERRCGLVDELNIAIHDAIAESDTDKTLKRMIPHDYSFLDWIHTKGIVTDAQIRLAVAEEMFDCDAKKRCISRNLIVPCGYDKEKHYSKFDVTDFGLEIIRLNQLQEADPNKLKKELREKD